MTPKATVFFRRPDFNMDRDTQLGQKPYQLPEIRGHIVHKDQNTKEEQNTYPKKSNSEIRN